MMDTSGRYGYPGASAYPQESQTAGGYMTGHEWSQRRPGGSGRYQTVPLGVYSMTEDDNYDVGRL